MKLKSSLTKTNWKPKKSPVLDKNHWPSIKVESFVITIKLLILKTIPPENCNIGHYYRIHSQEAFNTAGIKPGTGAFLGDKKTVYFWEEMEMEEQIVVTEY